MDISRSTLFASFIFIISNFLIVGSAFAVVIYDSGGPNNAQWRNSDYGNQFAGEAADDFMLAADNSVTTVHWYGSYVFTPDQPMPDDFTIFFYSDASNSPATDPFHTATFTSAVTRTSTGVIVPTDWGDFEMFEYEVDISALDLLGNTRYWLSIVNNTQEAGSYGGWAWAYNTDGSGTTHRWRSGGGDWTAYGSSNLAFSLHNNTSVPEPSAMLLLGIALAGLGFMRKREVA